MESRWFQWKGERGEDENRGWVLESKGEGMKGGAGEWVGGRGGGGGGGGGRRSRGWVGMLGEGV